MSRAPVAVVGGGVAGMAAAMRLAALGHDVVLLERRGVLGGKLATLQREGFSFDLGPSLLTLPQVFEELWHDTLGRRLAADLELVRLDPAIDHRFADGSRLLSRDAADGTATAVEALSPGSAAEWRRLLDRGSRVWQVAEPVFLRAPLGPPRELLRRLGSPLDLLRIDPLRTLAGRARATLRDPRLRQWAGRYATYSGSDPRRAPATLLCIPWVEQSLGCWYVAGGLGRLREAMATALAELGVEVRTGVEVQRLLTSGNRVSGVELAGGEALEAALVVATVDAARLYTTLLPVPAAARRLARAGRSSSGFVLCAGVGGRTPGLAHHTVVFAADPTGEFDDIHRRSRPPRDPTVYVCCSAVTDPSRAPAGDENWFILVNAPAGGPTVWEREASGYRDHILEILARRGLDLSGRTRFVEVLHPGDIGARDGGVDGAVYGTSSNGRRAAFLRPANRGAVPGLVLAGGSSHPGGGLPLVALSGAIAAGLADQDLRAR